MMGAYILSRERGTASKSRNGSRDERSLVGQLSHDFTDEGCR
jgi:hypothetical protein